MVATGPAILAALDHQIRACVPGRPFDARDMTEHLSALALISRAASFVALALLVIIGSVTSAAGQSAASEGRVHDARTGRPVDRARVGVMQSPAVSTTDEEGRFVIRGLSPGVSTVWISRHGYEVTRTLPIEPGNATTVTFSLTPAVLRTHEEIVVSGQRDASVLFDVPRSMSVLTSEELRRRASRTTPETLMDSVGIWVQKTNHGGGSPFLRGLAGNQILVLVDGIRLNNATFRLGPNQNLATIDSGQIEGIEVIRGTGSVLYGSDAIGGVINVITKRPDLSVDGPELHEAATTKFMSAGMERSGRLDVQVAAPRAALLGGISVRHFGDLRAGGGLGVEAPSGYDELNGDLKGLVRSSSNSLLTLAYQHVRQSDVLRFDQVAQRGFRRYSFDPQVRRLGYARLQMFSRLNWVHAINVIGSVHQSSERRIRERNESSTRTIEQDDLTVLGASIEVKSTPAAAWSIVSGGDTISCGAGPGMSI